MTKLIDEMVFDTKNDRWIFLSDLDSGEFTYNNKSVRVFTTDRGYKFFQTKWGNTQISSISWENCKETIKDRTENAEHYAELEELRSNSLAEMYKNNHNNWTGD
tara:strand:- start:528 stop:839 length:312 start_codon:yes stop_codon:yes gene_type:complete